MSCICEWPSRCGGTGMLQCEGCGGDLCVCECGGDFECFGCPDCSDWDEDWLEDEDADPL